MCAARIVVNEWLTTTTYDKPKDVDVDDAAMLMLMMMQMHRIKQAKDEILGGMRDGAGCWMVATAYDSPLNWKRNAIAWAWPLPPAGDNLDTSKQMRNAGISPAPYPHFICKVWTDALREIMLY